MSEDDPHGCGHDKPIEMDPKLKVEFDRVNLGWWAGEDGVPPFAHIETHLHKCAEAYADGDVHELLHQWDHFVDEVRDIDVQWHRDRLGLAEQIMNDPEYTDLMKAHAQKLMEASGIGTLLQLLKQKGADVQIINLSDALQAIESDDQFPGQYL